MGDVGRGHDEETKNGRTSRLLAETASAKAAASSEAPAAEAWNCIVFLTRGGSGRRECKFDDKARRKDREGRVREGRKNEIHGLVIESRTSGLLAETSEAAATAESSASETLTSRKVAASKSIKEDETREKKCNVRTGRNLSPRRRQDWRRDGSAPPSPTNGEGG